MSTTPSWYHSNTLAGLNHFFYNMDRPANWVDDKINPARYTKAGDKLHGDARMHGGDTVATLAAIYGGMEAYGAYGGGAAAGGGGGAGAAAGEGAGAGAGAGLGADAGFEGAEYGAGSGLAGDAAGGAGLGASEGFEGSEYGAGQYGAGGYGAGDGSYVFNGAQDSEAANEEMAAEQEEAQELSARNGFNNAQDSQQANAQMQAQQRAAQAQRGRQLQQAGNRMQQQAQQDQRRVEESNVDVNTPRLQNPYATSTKTAKTAPRGNVSAAMARGAAGTDAIDANGVQIASIQEITRRLQAAEKRLAALKGAKK